MTEEELRAACKKCQKIYPHVGCRGCPNYADIELVKHVRRQSQADLIVKLKAELEQVKQERDLAAKYLCENCAEAASMKNVITCCEMCHWHSAKEE